MRPLTRLRLVLPAQKDPGLRVHPTVELVASRLADALAVHGVQVRQQVQGAPPDGAPRADVALWLPDPAGTTPPPDARAAPARVHVALVADPSRVSRDLARHDALIVPYPALREPTCAALRRLSSRDVPVVVARLAGDPVMPRDAEKALHGVTGRPVVLLDAREGFDGEVERIIVQLALVGRGGAVVLLVPHDEGARTRVRTLCARHAVDAWIASGPEAFARSIAAVDLLVGRPTWDELALAALHRAAVAWLPSSSGRALLDAVHGARVVDEVMGTLQLAAFIDRRLADPGALEVRGMALRDALCGAERELLDALATLEPLPRGLGPSEAWEAVGPHAARDVVGEGLAVEARDAGARASPSRAQQIEDALEALKRKLAGEGGAVPPASSEGRT